MSRVNKAIWAVDSYEGAAFAGGASGLLSCVDLSSGESKYELQLTTGWINGVATHSSGLVVATTSRGELFAIDAHSGRIQRQHKLGRWLNGVRTLPHSENPRFVAGSAEGILVEWTPLNDQVCTWVDNHDDQVWMCSFSSDGALMASCGGNGELALWDVEGRRIAAWLSGGGYTITSVQVLSSHRYVASIDMGGALTFWSIDTQHPVYRINAHNERAWGIHANGTEEVLATVGAERRLVVWDVTTQTMRQESGVSHIPTACHVTSAGAIVVGDRSGRLQLVPGASLAVQKPNDHDLTHGETSRLVAYLNCTPDSLDSFSSKLIEALRISGRPFSIQYLWDSPLIRQSLSRLSGCPLFPQLYLDNRFLGGSEVVEEMVAAGALQRLFDHYSERLKGAQ